MKIKTLAVALLACAASVSAQESPVSPVPQKITVGTKAGFVPAQSKYTVNGLKTADKDAVAALQAQLPSKGTQPVKVVIGESGDKAVKKYESKIPAQAEGYYLSVTPGEVVIAGRDGAGTFYGVQSLLQLAEKDTVYTVEMTDWPTTTLRGTIEGFYGNPWSHQNRKDQFDFYARNKMNIYVYGPKDDPYHHSRWWEPYPADKAAELKELIDMAHANKVRFVWAMHPSNSIESDSDKQKALDKFQMMYDLGVRDFGIFFDDIDAKSVQAQIDYLNFLTDKFVKTHKDVNPLVMCPTQYNSAFAGWNPEPYLRPLGKGLYPEIEVMWTGPRVCNMIDTETCKWFTDATGRKAFIWLNYPVNDYGGHSLLMGPVVGNDPAISQMVSAFCSNPMQYAEASKVALYGLADFAWNPDQFDAQTSWERSLKHFQPEHTDAFRTFCHNNVDYYQSSHGLRMPNETPDFTAIKARDVKDYAPFFKKQVSDANELLYIADSDPMLSEIKEWIEAMRLQGKRGQALIAMQTAMDEKKPADFLDSYKDYKSLTKQAEAIVSRDFPGSIQSVQVTTGMTFVEPYIRSTAGDLIDAFKATGASYPKGLFPEQVLQNGNYYIKVNGQWLSNGSGADKDTPEFPTLLATADNINPNRQVWKIQFDANTGRYSLRSAHDDRYVNEILNFGRNPYSPDWNTYVIDRDDDGNYSIRNASSGGTNFWTAKNGRLGQAGNTAEYIFEIIPLSE